MKRTAVLFAILAIPCLCFARPVANWTYEKLTSDSDLIVVATPTESQDTKEPAVFPNMQTTDEKGKSSPVPAVGVESKFEVNAVLKGEKDTKTFVLYHLRDPTPVPVPNGPMVLQLDVKGHKRYLLFLKREADGRYVSVTGQNDSAIGVKELGAYP